MNVSDGSAGGFERRERLAARARGSTGRIVIRREDHIGDELGFIFLEARGGDHDAIIERLREYLGPRVRILKAEIGAEQVQHVIGVLDQHRLIETVTGANGRDGLQRRPRA